MRLFRKTRSDWRAAVAWLQIQHPEDWGEPKSIRSKHAHGVHAGARRR
jgi:hypothetical protein